MKNEELVEFLQNHSIFWLLSFPKFSVGPPIFSYRSDKGIQV